MDFLIDIRRAGFMLRHGVRLGVSLLLSRRRQDAAPVLIRETLQDLGMTGLKLGQFLALHQELLPPEVCRELGKLFENVAPMPFDAARSVIESDLGEPLSTLFDEFETESIAAASIAQVHLARNRDGMRVAVKVQRPGLRRAFDADMRNLRRFAALIDFLGFMNQVKLVEIAEEFSKYTAREMDFVIEGQTADRLRANAVCGEIVPRIFWGLSSRRVLTMEFIDGVSVAKATALIAAGNRAELDRLLPGLDIQESLHNLAFASIHQLYVVGFFHADPHPGNILLCKGNRIAFVDFGIFGEVSPMQRENLALHVEELIQGNLDRAARYYARAFLPTERTDPRRLQLQAREVQRQWLDAVGSSSSPAGMRTLAKFTDDMLAVVRQNHLRPSVDILLFVRGVVVVDATIRHLYGDFDLLAELQAFFGKFRTGMAGKVVAMLSPEPLLPTLVELARTSANSLNEILEGLVAGRFEMSVTVRDSAVAARRENRRVKRIVLALVGVSLLMLVRVAGAAPLRLAIAAGALALLALSLAPWRK